MKINFRRLLFYIFITFLIGSIFAIFVNNNAFFGSLNKPFDLPGIIFPIVWSILYLLMAISAYIISVSTVASKGSALKSYFLQLIVNSLWTLIFFGFKLYILSFIWILLLIFLVIIMIIKFYKINTVAGLLNILYFLWLLFASYLNLSIILLN